MQLIIGIKCPLEDVQKMLALNMMHRGFLSDPNLPGTEKLVVAAVNPKWLKEERMRICAADFGATKELLAPQVTFTAKGMNRAVSGLLCLMAAYELQDVLLKVRLTLMTFQHHQTCVQNMLHQNHM